jgi:hypothetical protein
MIRIAESFPFNTVTNTAGNFITWLDQALVNGSPTTTVTSIVVVDNVATVTIPTTASGWDKHLTVRVAGANESVFNGDFTITERLSGTQFTFDLVTPDATATGTVTIRQPPIGSYEKVYTGTNLAAYRSTEGHRRYLRVLHTSTTFAILNMYDTMSGISTGTGATSDVFFGVSATGTKRIRAIGNSKFFYIFCSHTTDAIGNMGYAFGDFPSNVEDDAFNTLLIGASTQPSNTSTTSFNGITNFTSASWSSSWLAGLHNQENRKANFGLSVPFSLKSSATIANFRNPGIYGMGVTLLPVSIYENFYGDPILRGRLPGLFCPIEQYPTYQINSTSRIVTINNKKYLPTPIDTNSSWFVSLEDEDWE